MAVIDRELSVRVRRREQTRREILEAAWRLAGRDGVASLSLRDLAREVGMRAPSLYTYFDSKAAIYDVRRRRVGRTPRPRQRVRGDGAGPGVADLPNLTARSTISMPARDCAAAGWSPVTIRTSILFR